MAELPTEDVAAILALLKDPCSRFIATFQASRPADIAELHVMTVEARASHDEHLRRFTESRAVLGDKVMPGLTILPAGESCSICGTVRRCFRWGSIPELPLHWGCRCVYLAWLND